MDPENQVRLVKFSISPGHTLLEWTALFDSTEALVKNANCAVCHCDGEPEIKKAFYASQVMSTKTKQTCFRHASWTLATKCGVATAENFYSQCAGASCEEVYYCMCLYILLTQPTYVCC